MGWIRERLSDFTDVSAVEPSDGQILVYDLASGQWVPSSSGGGGGGASLRGQATIEDPDTSVVVSHNIGSTPEPGEIQASPANDLGDAAKWWLSDLGATTFTINVDAAPGASGTALFDWIWTPAELAVPPDVPYFGDITMWLTAKSIDASNGDAIARWEAEVGPGVDVYGSTFRAVDFNGGPSVRIPGTGGYLEVDGSGDVPPSMDENVERWTMCVASQFLDASGNHRFYRADAGAGVTIYQGAPGFSTMYSGSAGPQVAMQTVPGKRAFVFDGTTSFARLNNTVDSDSLAANGRGVMGRILSHDSNTNEGVNSDVAEMLIYDRPLTNSEVDEVFAYFDAEWGL